MELPFHLRALPPEALDVLRFYGRWSRPVAYADEIISNVGLTERTFGKVVRRLVTKGYLQMDGDQAYRLSNNGRNALNDLLQHDVNAPAGESTAAQSIEVQSITRRAVLIAPQPLISGTEAALQVGFEPAAEGQSAALTLNVVVRVSVINGEPSRTQEAHLNLSDSHVSHSFTVIAGAQRPLRVRVQVFQLDDSGENITIAGGMYVDLDVAATAPAIEPLAAYGCDVVFSLNAE